MHTQQTELKNLLDLLAESSSDIYQVQQKKVAKEVYKNGGPLLLQELDSTSIPLSMLIEEWNRRLRLSLHQDVLRERILCGFSAFIDVVYTLEPDEFILWVTDDVNRNLGEGPSKTTEDIIAMAKERAFGSNNSKPGLLTKEIGAPLEMLAALLQAMRHPREEWKPFLKVSQVAGRDVMEQLMLDRQLWDKVRDYVHSRSESGAVKFRMGGASGNMAHVLSRLGLDTTGVWIYHSSRMADDSPDGLKRLRFIPDHIESSSAKIPGHYSVDMGEHEDDPVRRSFVFDFRKGDKLCGESAEEDARVIFNAPYYLSNKPKPWKRLILRTRRTGEEIEDFEVGGADSALGDSGWPFIPVFASRYFEGDTLVIELANDEHMHRLAEQFDYFMLGGIQAISDKFHDLSKREPGGRSSEPIVRTFIKHALRGQLDTLIKHGVVIHWEIGGIKSPRQLDELAEIAKGRVRSAGLNDGELETITNGLAFQQTRYFLHIPAKQGKMLTRYDRAVYLARQLDLDELYVHCSDADFIVRRRTTRGALRQEIAITLFAKGVVLLALLQRSVENWQNYIRNQEVPPVLKADGFIALLQLAEGLAKRHFRNNRELERRTFEDVIRSGYYYERNPEDYSVMVIPVMWPDIQTPFSVAGAGDFTSSVVAVYSGK